MTQYASDIPATQLFSTEDLPLSKLLPAEDIGGLLDRLVIRIAEEEYDPATETTTLRYGVVVEPEAAFGLPGLGGMELVAGGDAGLLGFELVARPDAAAATVSGGLSLRFPREWLRPVRRGADGWEDDPAREHVELGFGGGVTVDQDFDVTFEGSNEFTIQPAMIGDTGLVIEGTVAVDLSETTGLDESAAMGLDPSWRGVVFTDLSFHLPEDLDVPGAPSELELEHFHVGGGGITGTVSGNWDPGLAGELFGMGFDLRTVDVEFRETALVGASASGTVTLPFFDGAVDLRIGFAGDGTVTVALDDADGLVEIDHDAFGLEVDGLEFSTAGTPRVALSGTLTPKLIPDAPGVRVDELGVDADGNVHVEGGWLDVPEQYSVDFYGFAFEITALGMGRNDDGSKWVGLNGGVKFVDELAAGASVDGLRVTWFDEGPRADDAPQLSFEGVGVELEIPDAVRFKGAVSYRERALPEGATDHRFEGDISLDLLALDVSVDGKLVVGTREQQGEEYTYFAVSLGVDLPSGIPLFSTGLSVYGFEGLYAQNMSPALDEGEEWFTREDGVESWYHRPPAGATGFGGDPPKWPAREGDFAFGAGVTLGTASDNGYSFSGSLLLIVAFPGPVVMLNGEATLLSERSDLDDGEPNFSALAVLDGRAGTFTFGLDAQYRYGEGGELVDIGASVEAFYNLNDPTAWYVYIGRKEPREKRIRATLFSLFEANGYVMLDPRRLALGAWYGYDASYSFGPLGVDVEAWLSGDAVVSFQPAHFYGALAARGSVRLRAFGFGAGITLDAAIAADVFDPFHLLGKFRVAIELPGFLPDPSATVTLEWGPRKEVPPIPDPLQDVAVGHDLGTATWPLALGDATPPPDDEIPVVPLDGRPQLTFAASVHDDGYDVTQFPDGTPDPVGENAHPVDPSYVRVGDPAANEGPVEARYGLADVRVERELDGGWEPMSEVYGSWAPVPTLPEGDRTEGADPPMSNTKLSLFTPNPFEYVRHTGGTWGDAIAERASDYPCLGERDCWDFEGLSLSDFRVEETPYWGVPVTTIEHGSDADWPSFTHLSTAPADPPDVSDTSTADGQRRGLGVGFAPPGEGAAWQYLAIDLPEPRRSVAVEARTDKHCDVVGLIATDSEGVSISDLSETPAGDQRLVVTSREGTVDRILLVTVDFDAISTSAGDLAVLSVCAATTDLSDADGFDAVRERTVREQVARLGDEGAVFDPHSTYRIAIDTTVRARGVGEFGWYSEDRTVTQHAYFRTGGPPALTDLSLPEGADPEEFDSGLDDLTRYVRGTVPETVPARGEPPDLPRPVYRAYDVGARFNRSHVDRLYRSVDRDLSLVLFDRNNEPARDADGRLHVGTNQWGTQEVLSLDIATRQWLRAIDRGDCVAVDEAVVTRDERIDAAVGLGVLDPDEVYDARLVPRLLRDSFGDAATHGGEPPWTAVDRGGATGRWTVRGHPDLTGSRAEPAGSGFRLRVPDPSTATGDPPAFVDADLSGVEPDADVVRFSAAADEKTFRITAVDAAAGTVEVDGSPSFEASRWMIPGRGDVEAVTSGVDEPDAFSLWVRDAVTGTPAPRTWSDYRAATTVTLDGPDDAAGLAVRYDPDTGAHVRYVVDGATGERRLVRDDGTDTTVLDRSMGSANAVVAGRPYAVAVEAVGDAIRVYEDGDAVVESSGLDAERGGVALFARGRTRFGEVRVDDVSTDAPVAYRFAFVTSAFANVAHHLGSYADETWEVTSTADLDPQPRVGLADADGPPSTDEARAHDAAVTALDGGAGTVSERVETTAVRRDGAVRALLVESPEPLDWERTRVDVSHVATGTAAETTPAGAKVTDAVYGSETEVGVLLTDDRDLSADRVEFRAGGEGHEPSLVDPAFVDPMDCGGLDAYRVPAEAEWRRERESIAVDPGGTESTLLVDDSFPASAVWSVAFGARATNTVGLAFRVSNDAAYRFTVGPGGRELAVYDVAGKSVLWADDVAVPTDEPIALRVEARDDLLWVYAADTDVPVCAVADPDPGGDGSFGPVVEGTDPVAVTTVAAHDRADRAALFVESFEDPGLAGWTAVDEPPATTRQSDWRVRDGTLEQHSNIYGFHGKPYGAPGTYLVADETVTDGRVTVRLRSDDDDAIGVMVRCRDDENYYRFSMDSERSYRRFDSQVDGVTVPLWRDDVAFEPGREYVLTIDCDGDRFTGYLDGVELFDVRDDAHATGSVALYCRANDAARFHDVRVTAAADQWVTYHAFADGTAYPAGTQLRLHTGASPTRTGAGIVPVAVDDGPRPPATGADFRILGPDAILHERGVLPDAAFATVPGMTLSRSSDGTDLLLFAGTELDPGTYRIDVEYARDGDRTLRQAGDSSPERARLDVTVHE